MSPAGRTFDKKQLFPEIATGGYNIVYQSPTRKGAEEFRDKMPSFETHKLEQLNNEVLKENEQDVFERETTLPDVSVFSSGKTKPFPERDHVLAAKNPSVSVDDKDRLDIVGLPVTYQYKVDEIPEETIQVSSKATDGIEKRIKLVRDRIGSIEQEFLKHYFYFF